MSPEGLKSRGKTLWDGVTSEVELDAAGLSILEDACRTADLVELISKAASSNGEIMRLADEAEEIAPGAVKISIVMNPLFGELRQQRLAFKQLIAQLKLGKILPKVETTKSAFSELVASLMDDENQD
jgi:hypothetical protein